MIENKILADTLADRANYAGLTTTEAQKRLKDYGENARTAVKQRTWLKRLGGVSSEPMILFLLAATGIYFFLGDKLETIILLASLAPVVAIQFIQEARTDQAVSALNKLMVRYSAVKRDNKIIQLESRLLVPGDLVYLTAGDQIPADGVALKTSGLLLDESILTGESAPAVKAQAPDEPDKIKEENKLYQGTLVVSGEGYMLITATGGATVYGELGGLLENIKSATTPLQTKIRRLVRGLAIIAVVVAISTGLIVATHDGALSGLLAGITMAMSLIPEEIPIVFSVFLIMGVWRMAKQKALVRKMAMVETLGSATVICTDKTGTLTEGNMALKEIYYRHKLNTHDEILKSPEHFTPFFESALLALEQIAIDPLEIETQRFAGALGLNPQKIFESKTMTTNAAFSAESRMVHHVWKNRDGKIAQYSGGAPEAIIGACELSEENRKKILLNYENLAANGRRIVAVAKKDNLKESAVTDAGLEFIGLISMVDPPRANVKEAIDVCQKAGIRIVMITGDNKLTAHSIAESIGLKHREEIVSGADLENLSPAALQEAARRHDIFARMRPEQKYDLVCALQDNGEVVAMTGDGVNDAPALKKANIGIAMGKRGTEVARAAAGMVLLDDNFSSIINAVREGRRIYANLRQAFSFLFAFHLPIVILALVPPILGHSMIFHPIHIIFLEIFCDPAAVLGFEREKARRGLMTEPPRPANEPIIKPKGVFKVIAQGLVIAGVALAFYFWGLKINGEDTGRTLAFGALVVAQIALIIFSREYEQVKNNRLLLNIGIGTIIATAIIVALPFTRNVFHFTAPTILSWILIFVVPIIAMAIVGNISKYYDRQS